MTTINLRDGLEVLYYFGEQDFDLQRNQLQDHSGYGRHAKANGSVSVGVNGPNDFEAASFDGDDYFDVGETVGLGQQTIFAIARFDGLNGNKRDLIASESGSDSNGFNLRKDDSNDLNFFVYDGSGTFKGTFWSGVQSNTWYKIIALFDGNRIALIVENEVKDETPASSISSGTTNTMKVGANGTASTFMQGDIAVAARWSRVLSRVEREALTDLTAPLRAQL